MQPGRIDWGLKMRTSVRWMASLAVAAFALSLGVASVGPAAPANAATRPTFVQVALGVDRAAAVSTGGRVYAWGRQDQVNQQGDLGYSLCIGSAATIDRRMYGPGGGLMAIRKFRTSPALVRTPAGLFFTQVAAGDGFLLARASNGAVYAWGTADGGVGAMGISSASVQESDCPKRVPFPVGVKIKQISTTESTSIALTTDGDLYQWGNLGPSWTASGTLVQHNVNKPTKVKVPAGLKFTWAAAGGGTFKARAADGTMYAWGSNADCQFGRRTSDTRFHPTPIAVPAPTGVTFKRAAGDAGLAVSSAGEVFAWGENRYGELGNGLRDTSTSTAGTCATRARVALPLAAGVKVIDVANGWDPYGATSFAVAANGTAYGWGQNAGYLGDGTKVAYRLRPVPLKLPSTVDVRQISASANAFFGARSALALTTSGRVYGWGLGSDGVIGGLPDSSGKFPSHPTPVLVG